MNKIIVSLAFLASMTMTSAAFAVIDAKTGCGADDAATQCTKETAATACKGDTPICLLANLDAKGGSNPRCAKKQPSGCKAKLATACASGKHKAEGICE